MAVLPIDDEHQSCSDQTSEEPARSQVKSQVGTSLFTFSQQDSGSRFFHAFPTAILHPGHHTSVGILLVGLDLLHSSQLGQGNDQIELDKGEVGSFRSGPGDALNPIVFILFNADIP